MKFIKISASLTSFTSVLCVIAFLVSCSGGGGGDSTSDTSTDTTTDGGTDTNTTTTPLYSGFDFTLQDGDYWEFYWKSSSASGSQTGSSSTSSDSGSYRITLNFSNNNGSFDVFALDVIGKTVDSSGNSFAPRWSHMAISDNTVLASLDGSTFVTIFDAFDGKWVGGGFFTDFGDNPIASVSTSVNNDFINTTAFAAGRDLSVSSCQYYPGVGTICTGDVSYTIIENEYYKPGMGPIAYNYSLSYSDSGGGFTTWTNQSRELGLVSTSFIATDGFQATMPPWVQKTGLSILKTGFCAEAIGGKVYVTGGAVNGVDSATVDIYDPATDGWSSGVSMPMAKKNHDCAQINGALYVTGGYSGGVATNSIYTFDPATSTWSIVSPSLQEARADHVTGVVDSALVTLGGVGKTSVEFVYPYGVSDAGATMPVAMNYMGGESVNTGTAEVIYLMGGVKYYIYGCNDAEYISTCQSVDPVNSWAWKSCAPLPTAKANVASVVMSGKIYVMGGRNCSGDLSEVNAYDPASNSWSTLSSMLYATSKASAATVDGKIYNFYQKDGEIKVEEYDPLRE